MREIILKQLRDALLERSSLELLPDVVWKRSAALNTWGTNAIEGSTITLEDAQRILLDGYMVGGKPVRDIMETVQHERAFRGLLQRRQKDITSKTILELHEEVFFGVLSDTGRWRRINVRIEGARFSPPRMQKVVKQIDDWQASYRQRSIEGENVFELGAWMHFHFQRIHPFSDGNGRVGRLLLNLHFLKHNWPPAHITPRQRDQYLNSLNMAAEGDLTYLENLLRILMGASLVDLLDQVGTSEDELISLKEVSRHSPYDMQYLALRCKQGEIPAIRTGGRWRTSLHAIKLYRNEVGTKK